MVLSIFPTERFNPVYSPSTVLRFVAGFARVRIENSSRNRFASTAYFAQSQTTLFPCILFMGGMFRGRNNWSGTFRGEFSGGEYSGHPRTGTPIPLHHHIWSTSRHLWAVIFFRIFMRLPLKNSTQFYDKRAKKNEYNRAKRVKIFSTNKFSIIVIKNCQKYHWIQNKKIQHIITSERKKMLARERSE